MRPDRNAYSLRAALEEVTPDAPHLVHTVMAGVRAAASQRPPGRGLPRRVTRPGSIAAMLALLVTLVVGSIYWADGIGRLVAGATPGSSRQSTPSWYRSFDSISIGSVVSANEAWVVRFHMSLHETQPGFYSNQPGTTPFTNVYRTTDGGRTWIRKLHFDGTYGSMRFSADGRHGVVWHTDGSVYRTVDGGDHWSVSRVPEGLFVYGMTFLDPDHGWAMLYPSVGRPLTMDVTSDGGQTWQARGNLDLTGDPTSVRIGLHFADLNHGLFLPEEMGIGWPVFLVTDDGGRTWRRVGPAIAPDADTSLGMSTSPPIIFANGTGVLIVVDGGDRLFAYSTTDFGSSWSSLARVALPSLPATGQVIHRTWIADARHWWVLSEVMAGPKVASSQLIATADAGQHWTSLPSDRLLADVVFASPSIAWAVYGTPGSFSDRLARTTDGGAHWTTLALPSPAGS